MAVNIQEIQAKSIVSATKVPSADYVINPYTGCQFACMYCFASFMGRFIGEKISNWGNYVYVKTNAVDLMKKEISHLLKKSPPPRISISTVTDPYQRVEKQYRLTRGILQIFADRRYQGRVSILTKSPMVYDDVELLKKIPNAEVGISITTTDDKLSRFLEVQAPSASARLKTLKKLNDAGIKTYVFVGPLLPHMTMKPELIDQLFFEIKKAGTNDIKIEYLNLPSYVRPKLNELLKDEPKEVQGIYATSQQKQYRDTMEPMLRANLAKHGLTLRFDEIIHHTSEQNLKE
ncbi:spore photoproduct lyase family protein [Vibrio alfacsensis]|uniref:spore photoproduct lyase family protein n=1 Tax=Vibrio alfacsensis TaxID=1074311 RepID=UPI0040681D0A